MYATSRLIRNSSTILQDHLNALLAKCLASKPPNKRTLQALKAELRRGVPDNYRGVVWSNVIRIACGGGSSSQTGEYAELVKRHQLNRGSDDRRYPTFMGQLSADRLVLSKEGFLITKNILQILAFEYPHLEACPPLPNLVALLLHHLPADETLAGVRWMLNQSLSNRCFTYLPVNNGSTSATLFNQVFDTLLEKQSSNIRKQMKSPLNEIALNGWLVDVLPLSAVFRMIDSYLLEGYKIVYRYGLAVFQMHFEAGGLPQQEDDLLIGRLERSLCDNATIDRSSRQAFMLPLKRSSIERIRRRCETAENLNRNKESLFDLQMFSTKSPPPPSSSTKDVYLDSRHLPRLLSRPSPFVGDSEWEQIWSWIPPKYRHFDVELLFDSCTDGHWLKTLYAKCQISGPLVILIETITGKVFGAFQNQGWPDEKLNNQFFGTDETFLFDLLPISGRYQWVGSEVNDELKMKELLKTGSMFIFGTKKYLAIGGGGVNFGLTVDEMLNKGTTGRCETFNNPPLGGQSTFDIRRLEVWALR